MSVPLEDVASRARPRAFDPRTDDHADAGGWRAFGAEYIHPRDWVRVPWRNRHFWATQALVILIAAAHGLIETLSISTHAALYFVPLTLFFIPVVYAATAFGIAGSVPTALWCTLLTIPNGILWHEGAERIGEFTQMGAIVMVAVFVGVRVDQQRKARAAAEAASQAFRVSEAKYRGLFEASGEAVLVLREGEQIVECNAAAGRLLGQPREALRDRRLSDVMPAEAAASVARAVRSREAPAAILLATSGRSTWVEPVCASLPEAPELTHVVLRDVSVQKERERRLETFARAVLNAQEEERRRVAQELHDDTIQGLVQLCRMIDECEEQENCGARARDVRHRTEGIIGEVRRFANGLRPPAIDDLGLAEAVERLVRDLENRSPIEAEFRVTGAEGRLSPESKLALFRIAQEAMRNVERHSHAGRVQVALHFAPEAVRLLVVDDGDGFDAPSAADRSVNEQKLGLMGMRERAHTVGGTFVLESRPGRGTSVVAEAPTR
jgi:PAS domain S-box-containing protein